MLILDVWNKSFIKKKKEKNKMIKSGIKLITIQKRNNLNDVYATGKIHEVNKGVHQYTVFYNGLKYQIENSLNPYDEKNSTVINFQNGPRNVKGSIPGVLDSDLIEIVKHRYESFQSGPYSTRENAIVISYLEKALLYMNKRAEDRFEANKLGTNKI